jgi:hypothetical protein
MELSGAWEVALVEIHYPHSLFNVTKENNNILYKKVDDDLFHVANIPARNYNAVHELVNAINSFYTDTNLLLSQHPSSNVYYPRHPKDDMHMNVYLSRSVNMMLGFHPDADLGMNVEAQHTPNVRLGLPSQMYVYCDIIESGIIGDTVAPLLRIVNMNPVQRDFGSQAVEIFNPPHYVPVEKVNFETIEILIRDTTGQPIPFMFGIVCVKLHFRPVR